MWNMISCKSDYKEYLKQREDEKLSKCILNIKPSIVTSRKKSKALNCAKPPKTNRVESVRKQQIKEENKSLLKRMLRIDLKSNEVVKKIAESVSTKSLNKNFRLKKSEEIQNSNKNLTKRLKTTGSVYSIRKWEEANRFHEYVRDNITRNSGRVGKRKIIDCEKKSKGCHEFSDSLADSLEELLGS